MCTAAAVPPERSGDGVAERGRARDDEAVDFLFVHNQLPGFPSQLKLFLFTGNYICVLFPSKRILVEINKLHYSFFFLLRN